MKTTTFKLRKLTVFAVFFAMILSINACKKDNKPPSLPDSNQVDIYVAGYEAGDGKAHATVWKNGNATYLPDGPSSSYATSVFVHGNDVYLAGYADNGVKNLATVWKNNVATTLNSGSRETFANSVFVQNNQVYVGGYSVVPGTGREIATIWKDGSPTDLPVTNNLGYSRVNSVFVQGNDVHAVGYEESAAKIWKNNTSPHTLSGVQLAQANSVFVQGNNVYVAGKEYIIAKLWINDTTINITNGTNSAVANSVFVKDNIAYVAGYESNGTNRTAKVWKIKDGEVIDTQLLTDGTTIANAFSIFVLGNDVYVVGHESTRAKLWINGKATNLSDVSSQAYSIYVVKK